MQSIHTTIDIDAPADIVWEVLTDFAAYPEWNDYTRITGTPAEGERLTVAPGPDAGRMPTFRPRVLRAEDNELAWLGHLWVRGLFDGEHSFVVEQRAGGRSRLVQSEESFEGVNRALKARAETLAAETAA